MSKRQPSTAGGGRDDSLLANIALLYYKEGLNQNEIAKRTGLSRATVVNYLREARMRGIVDIRVQGKQMTVSSHARQLRERLGLDDVYVADTGDDTNADMNLRQTARVAAAAFFDIVAPGDRIGVAWGQTMKLMADEMSQQIVPDAEVCQIIGAMDTTRLLATETCAIEIASKIGAVCHTLHAPAVLSSRDLAQALQREPTIRRQLDRLKTLDCVFSSVGDLDGSSHVVTAGIVSEDEIAEICNRGGAGFFCSRFLDQHGACVDVPIYDKMIAAGLDDLKGATRRVVAASGAQKLAAVLAAIRGGHVTHLIVDQVLAEAILDSA
ncbi:MAG: sugar-binding transcriptional regulator [Marinibacterium sp.]